MKNAKFQTMSRKNVFGAQNAVDYVKHGRKKVETFAIFLRLTNIHHIDEIAVSTFSPY